MTSDVGAESTATPCTATPEQEEGPYYRRLSLERQDITEGCPGVALQLQITVRDTGCVPIPDAVVDVWHCDGLGTYSWYAAAAELDAHGTGDAVSDADLRVCAGAGLAPGTFLRGWQRSDSAGACQFQTIYPGWYPGRAVHIHVKVYVGTGVLTSQLYFPDELTDETHRLAPYRQRPHRDTRNADDVIFRDAGQPTLVTPVSAGDGYLVTAMFTLA